MRLKNRDSLLEALATQLQSAEYHRVVFGCLKVTLFDEDGEELFESGVPEVLNLLASDLWQTADTTDISDAASLLVGIY